MSTRIECTNGYDIAEVGDLVITSGTGQLSPPDSKGLELANRQGISQLVAENVLGMVGEIASGLGISEYILTHRAITTIRNAEKVMPPGVLIRRINDSLIADSSKTATKEQPRLIIDETSLGSLNERMIDSSLLNRLFSS